jgi:diguanylate cyclase (GGDEF)-like protein/PAS domain S-box-containing protein
MLEHPTLAVAIIDQGRIRETNGPWQTMFALPTGVAVESHIATLFPNTHNADRFARMLRTQMAMAVVNDSPSATTEHTLVRRDGTTFLAELMVWLFDKESADHPATANAIWQVRDITAERAIRRELRDLEDYHRELSQRQWDLTFVIDRKGRVSYASPSIEEALGYRLHAMLGESFTSLLEPSHAATAEQWLRTASRVRKDGAVEASDDGYRLHVRHHDGSVRILACRPRNCFEVPRISGMVVHARDVTDALSDEAKIAEQNAVAVRLRERLSMLAAAAASSFDARIEALVGAARAELGVTDVAFRPESRSADQLSPRESPLPERRSASADSTKSSSRVAQPNSERSQLRVIDGIATADSATRKAGASSRPPAKIEAPVFVDDVPRGWLVVSDSAARTWSFAEVDFVVGLGLLIALAVARRDAPAGPTTIVEQFATDALTGLPDRVAADRWLTSKIASSRVDQLMVVMIVDLDRLQDINDRHGYAIGDSVIAKAARALAAAVGPEDFVARIGGDEFLIVLSDSDARATDTFVEALLERIAGATEEGDGATRMEASIGVARWPGDGADAATLWLHADLAMREAKNRGRGKGFLFNQHLGTAVRVKRALDAEIADALSENEFALFYQPQISLASGKVVGLEALLRWQHPTRGLLLPEAFIDAAVERGLIDAVTKSVLSKVCEQIATWRRAGDFPELPVGVNVSGSQFHDRRLPALVAAALMRSGLPARLLVLELTEQTLIGGESETERVVKELSRLGVRTAIGGFGLGYESLKLLRQLRVAQIKLDRAFVAALPGDDESAVVVNAVIEIARRLKCQVVAEGVETRAQFEHLRTIGCEAGQGFYFGAPLSAEEIRTFVESNRKNPIH